MLATSLKLKLIFLITDKIMGALPCMLCRWRTECGDLPFAYPYVEFPRGLPLYVEEIESNGAVDKKEN